MWPALDRLVASPFVVVEIAVYPLISGYGRDRDHHYYFRSPGNDATTLAEA